MTVLQGLLSDAEIRRAVAAELGKDRSTLYRWRRGLSFPTRADAERLVVFLSGHGLDFNGCYRPFDVEVEP